jgi:hypothetical protein
MKKAVVVAGLVGVVLVAAAGMARAVDIYVNKVNEGGTENGNTWPTAWGTIAEGLTDLAGEAGDGHTIHVAAGTYAEQLTIGATHSGAAGSPNMLTISNGLAVGDVRIEMSVANNTTLLEINDCDYFTLDGLQFRQLNQYGNWALWILGGSQNVTVENCNLLSMGVGSAYVVASSKAAFLNSTMTGSYQYGGLHIAHPNSVSVTNCIFVNNSPYGLAADDGDATVGYCCFYGNAFRNCRNTSDATGYHTAAEINGRPGFTNNIVANPSFSDLADNWNFNAFYTNSPCLTNGLAGVRMGATQNPTIDPVSSNTYYVDRDDGAASDAYSKSTATNPATPWKTITNAAANAVAGDTVVIKAGGDYTDWVVVAKGGAHNAPLTFRGETGTIMRPGYSAGNAISFTLDRVADVILEGIRFKKANIAVRMSYAFANTVTNCVFHDGGVSDDRLYEAVRCLRGSGNTVIDSDVIDCAQIDVITGYAALGCAYGSLSVDRCNIFSNALGFASNRGFARFRNCNIYNSTTWGLNSYNAFVDSGGCTVENCDLYGNAEGAIRLENVNGAYTVKNCIIAGNGCGIRENSAAADVRATYNCFWNNVTNFYDEGTTALADPNAATYNSDNIVANPLFVDEAGGDFHIAGNSPCRNAGTPTTDLATDLYGSPRLLGGAVDMGSHELVPPAGTVVVLR